jgi:hypothetical protein
MSDAVTLSVPLPLQAGRKPTSVGDAPAAKAFDHDRDCGRRFRSRQPISAYTGANGSGKTLAMVHDTIPSLCSGRDIFTTVPLFMPGGFVPGNVHVLCDWSQILNAEHADILLDEVSAICSSRDTESLPPQMATLLQQLRKRDLVLRWTAPNWARADRIIRETTTALTICHGYFPKRQDNSEWPTRSFFIWKTYNAADYSDFTSTNSTMKRLKPLQTSLYLLSRHPAAQCYDTLSSVSTIGTVLMSGRCAVCGGRRRVPECTCDEYVRMIKKR